MEIVAIDEESPYIEEVIGLGQANAATLGFLPKGAYIDYATRNQILVALNEDRQVLAYFSHISN